MEWSLGKRVKIARIERDISQQDLAALTGLRQAHVSLIENDRHDPSATAVRNLALALEVSADYLLGLSGELNVRRGRKSGKKAPELALVEETELFPAAAALIGV
jgi:transcriptional regulator with XRE-family HTH domain